MTKKAQIRKAILFMLPSLVLIFVFFALPVFVTVFYSFTDKTLVGAKAQNWNLVGLKNYLIMFKDERFYKSLINTIVFLFMSALVGQQVLGFTLAYFMEKKSSAIKRFVGTAVLLGWVTPEVVVSFIFFAFLNTEGSLNNVLGNFGIGPIAWLFDHAMLSIIFANVWRGTAFSMMIFQSSLGNVSDSIKEAGKIDGANGWQVLIKIILPMIKGSIVTNTILITLQTIGLFGLIYALTGGGPGYDTTTVPIYMYNQAFSAYQLGYGTAMAIIMVFFGMIMSMFYMKSFKQKI